MKRDGACGVPAPCQAPINRTLAGLAHQRADVFSFTASAPCEAICLDEKHGSVNAPEMASSRPLGSDGKYPKIRYIIPAAVRKEAKRGLEMRALYGRGGTDVGRDRAKQLVSAQSVTLRDVVFMRSYFRRHAGDNLSTTGRPSNGLIAWLLWGGHAGRQWVESAYDRAARDGLISAATAKRQSQRRQQTKAGKSR